MADDPFERMLNDLVATMASEYNETIHALTSALLHSGVSKKDIDAVMMQVPDFVAPFMSNDTKENMKLMDLVFLGLVVHQFRDHFTERNESD